MPRQSAKPEPVAGWIWLFTGLFIGLFAGGLIYLHKHSEKPLQVKDPAAVKSAANNQTIDQAPVKAEHPQPRFDFYTILPKNQTPEPQPEQVDDNPPQPAVDNSISDEDKTPPITNETDKDTAQPAVPKSTAPPIEKPAAPAPKPLPNPAKAVTKPKENIILTVAALKSFADADRLKAQLSLLGFDVQIKTIKIDDVPLYRVWLGPYHSATAAKKDQQRLMENHFKSLMIKQTPEGK